MQRRRHLPQPACLWSACNSATCAGMWVQGRALLPLRACRPRCSASSGQASMQPLMAPACLTSADKSAGDIECSDAYDPDKGPFVCAPEAARVGTLAALTGLQRLIVIRCAVGDTVARVLPACSLQAATVAIREHWLSARASPRFSPSACSMCKQASRAWLLWRRCKGLCT